MIFFRADGNEIIGLGHIMRCLSIAQELKCAGEECVFIMADRNPAFIVKNAGFEVFVLNTDFRNMHNELKHLISFLKQKNSLCIIVDSYYVTEEYLEVLRKFCLVIYVDDLAVSAYPVDVLVNYNIYGEEIDYVKMYHDKNLVVPKLLLGPKYAPLRSIFKNLKKKQQSKIVKDILISTGGSDSNHLALKIAQYLVDCEMNLNYKYHFLLGAMNSDIVGLSEIKEKLPDFIEIHQNIKRMPQLMQNCDIAVSAAGSTLYELCACGIPTITYVLADNQILGAHTFAQKGIMLYVGDCRSNENFIEHIMQAIEKLSRSYRLRKQMAKQAQKLVLGDGAEVLVENLKFLF